MIHALFALLILVLFYSLARMLSIMLKLNMQDLSSHCILTHSAEEKTCFRQSPPASLNFCMVLDMIEIKSDTKFEQD